MAFLATVIHKLDRTLMRQLDERASGFGISAPHILVLDALSEGFSTPSTLAMATGLDPASISATVKSLHLAGVIERKSDLKDLRSVRILFTKKGENLFQKIKNMVVEFEQGPTIKEKLKELKL